MTGNLLDFRQNSFFSSFFFSQLSFILIENSYIWSHTHFSKFSDKIGTIFKLNTILKIKIFNPFINFQNNQDFMFLFFLSRNFSVTMKQHCVFEKSCSFIFKHMTLFEKRSDFLTYIFSELIYRNQQGISNFLSNKKQFLQTTFSV